MAHNLLCLSEQTDFCSECAQLENIREAERYMVAAQIKALPVIRLGTRLSKRKRLSQLSCDERQPVNDLARFIPSKPTKTLARRMIAGGRKSRMITKKNNLPIA
jgi:hypothetical protein